MHSLRSAGIVVLMCLCFSFSAMAQRVNKPAVKPPKAFDKVDGEEYQIKQRVKWFQESRGLYDVSNPARLRRNAADQVRTMRNRESRRPFRAGWTEVGPSPMTMLGWAMGRVAGRVSAVAIHPTDRDIIYLGAAGGGLWKTTDGGTAWVCLSNDLGTQSIGSLFIDPSDPETLWVGTGEHAQGCTGYFGQGIYKSTDGGATLVPMNGSGARTLDLSFIASIVFHPSDDSVILVSGHGYCDDGSFLSGGIFRTTDGGLNWDRVLTGQAGDLISLPSDPDVFYAAVGRASENANGIYRSTDGGAGWDRFSNGIPTGSSLGRMRLSMAPSNNQILYAYNSGSGGQIFKTTDGGTSWAQTASNSCDGQCWYNHTLDINPTDPDTIVTGNILIYKSTASGASPQALVSGWGGSQKVHQDTHVVLYDNTDPNKFWIGGDGGLWRTDDGGANYVNLNGNLNITQFYDIAVSPHDPGRIFGGAQDNSSLGTDSNLVWDVNIVSGDGFMNLVDPLDGDIVYQTSYPGSTASIARSTSGGSPGTFSWLSMTGTTSGGYPWVTPLEITANSAGTQSYVFVGNNRVHISSDNGLTWAPLSSGALANDSLSVITARPEGDRVVVYAGSSSGEIFRTDNALDATPTWVDVQGNYPGGNVSDVAMDPTDSLRVFVTRGAFGAAKLYRSTTGGSTWDAVGTGLPNVPANSVAIDPADTNRIFVGSDVGVFESVDGGLTFTTMMIGFPLGVPVQDLEVLASPHLLTAGTYGRGAWQIDLTLAELGMEAGPDQDICLGEFARLQAVASNGSAPLEWLWTVVSGPDTSASQFSDPTVANPDFTASVEGTYVLSCQVTDNLSRVVSDTLTVLCGSVADYTAAQQEAWGNNTASASWDAQYDRNDDGRVDILDLMLQTASPVCN